VVLCLLLNQPSHCGRDAAQVLTLSLISLLAAARNDGFETADKVALDLMASTIIPPASYVDISETKQNADASLPYDRFNGEVVGETGVNIDCMVIVHG